MKSPGSRTALRRRLPNWLNPSLSAGDGGALAFAVSVERTDDDLDFAPRGAGRLCPLG
jgi:hypothetical protein